MDVPDSSAHAWAEIYLDGYGWYPVEVTPGYGGGGGQRRRRPHPLPDPCTGNHPHTHQGPHDRGGADSGPHPDAAARQRPRRGWRGGKGRPAPAVDGSVWPWPDPVGGSLPPAASPAGKASAPPGVGGETNQAVLAAYGYLNACCPGADRRTPGWRSWPARPSSANTG
ncbi:MAG: hypothetical protein ACLSAF_10150 [Intestinimonas sp.]